MKFIRNNRGTFGLLEFALGVGLIVGFTGVKVLQGHGQEPVKNCIGTHTNGNCAHLPLSDFEKSGKMGNGGIF